ncbi:MAG TPA: pitrilysin family protein [Dissulfurispiraceae bacterium]|nr:pitrilysin family protein [Dissulfurispiraceae bacterium]
MFTRRYLDNGIPVVMEQLKAFRSVIAGIWVKVGSRYETEDKNGMSHFLEHMFFKGTHKRSAADISMNIDSLGGDLNAFTSRENTAFYVKVLDEYTDKGIELLSDIFLHSTFAAEEIEKEKGVIKEEIKMVEDTPDDYIHDLFNEAVFGKSGLGQPVLGRRETVKQITRDDLVNHVRKYYGTADTVISCAGNIDPDRVVGLLNQYLGELERGSEPEEFKAPIFSGGLSVHPKDLSETHICLGVPATAFSSPDRYSVAILNCILGSSVSSRLFQEIREKKGFAYSIYSFVSSYKDCGYWAVYAGTGKKRAAVVTELILSEMKSLADTITDEEVRRAKDQLKGNMILGMESTSSRMQSIARQQLYFKRHFSQNDIMKAVEAVTLDQVKTLSRALINESTPNLTLLGPVRAEDFAGLV